MRLAVTRLLGFRVSEDEDPTQNSDFEFRSESRIEREHKRPSKFHDYFTGYEATSADFIPQITLKRLLK